MMLHIDNDRVRKLLLQGNFGLERESLRVTPDGHLSHTAHPFDADDSRIVRDFCENQTEINTSVHKSAEMAMEELGQIDRRIVKRLRELPQPELLWPFSNPPYIMSEEDIPVAQFSGRQIEKTTYRNGLSDKYGRYKMTFSGIHFNYSFAGDLLRANYEADTLFVKQVQESQTMVVSTQPLDNGNWQPVPFLQLLVYRQGELTWQGKQRSQQFFDKEKDWEYKNFDYSTL